MELILAPYNNLCLKDGNWEYDAIEIMSNELDIDFKKLCRIIENHSGEIFKSSKENKWTKAYFGHIEKNARDKALHAIIQELEPYLVMNKLIGK